MFAATDETIIPLGPARFFLTPLEPVIWQPPAGRAPGAASLCLALLPLANLRWENVYGPDGKPAPPGPEAWAALPVAAVDPLLKALCAPWFTDQEETELSVLKNYLSFSADYPQISCAACAEQEKRGEGRPDCPSCPLPSLPLAVEPALGLYGLLARLPENACTLAADLFQGLSPRRKRILAAQLGLIHVHHLSRREESD